MENRMQSKSTFNKSEQTEPQNILIITYLLRLLIINLKL